jgi:hypothetical protein
LREVEMEGGIVVSMEREPDSALGAGIEGPEHQRVVAHERGTGEIVAMGSRSVRERWVAGELRRVGYYGELRVATGHRARPSLVRGGFEVMRRLHETDGRTELYFASVVEGNAAAMRLFEAQVPGFPRCRRAGELVTLVVRARARRRVRTVRGLEIRRAAQADVDELVACLARSGRRHDLSPRWTREDLLSGERTRGLALEDFFIAERSGRAVGCLALWDQRSFKQVVVRGYGKSLARMRGPLNIALTLAGRPALPAPGSRLEQACASHLALEDDDPTVACCLLRAVERAAVAREIDQLVLGFAADSPTLAAVGCSFPGWRYRSTLLALPWELNAVTSRPWRASTLSPEVAVL